MTPRFARWLATVTLPAERRGEVLGDLEEHFRRLRDERGPHRARLWYLRQAMAFAALGSLARLRSLFEDGGDLRASVLASSLQDLRFALRGLGRNRGFTGAAILTLAVGIGGATAVFSLVDGVLLRPLHYPDSERLVAILDEFDGEAWWSAAPRNVRAWRDRSTTLEAVGWAQPDTRSFSARGAPEELRIQRVSAGFLEVLGVEPRLGRGFEEREARSGAPPVTVLTHHFWTSLGSDPGMVGETVAFDGVPHTVVGVLPPGAVGEVLEPHDALVPRIFSETELRESGRVLRTVGRLASPATLAEAEEELEWIMTEAEPRPTLTGGSSGGGWGVRLVPLREHLVGDVRHALLLMLGAVGFVLLIASANVSNLLLARGSTRSRELAVRSALGAGRRRVVRLLLAESLVIALIGGVAGSILALWGANALIALAPDALPRMRSVSVDGRVLTFALLISTAVGVVFGLVPALRGASHRGGEALSSSSRGDGIGSRKGTRLRSILVAAEVALILVLLTGASLTLASFSRLRSVDPGFPIQDRVVVEMTLPESRYDSPLRVSEFFRELTRGLRELPGVVEAGSVSHPPLFGDDWSSYHIVESGPPPRLGEEPIGGMEAVSPGYFRALGVPLVEGRVFEPGDGPDGPPVVVVDEAMAARHWPDRSPVGDRVRLGRTGPLAQWHDVVGVVGATRYELASAPRPRLYLPDNRLVFDASTRYVVVRAEPDRLEAVIPLIRARIREMAPDIPIASLRTLEAAAAGSVARARLQTFLLGVFGGTALLLGVIGVYGVVSYSVGRRTREVGLRIALGAGRARVLGTILGREMAPVMVGLLLGAAAVLGLGRFLSGILFEVNPTDPTVLGGATLGLLLLAAAAALVPSLRASQIDPRSALRAE